jgi:hypothetical protein
MLKEALVSSMHEELYRTGFVYLKILVARTGYTLLIAARSSTISQTTKSKSKDLLDTVTSFPRKAKGTII